MYRGSRGFKNPEIHDRISALGRARIYIMPQVNVATSSSRHRCEGTPALSARDYCRDAGHSARRSRSRERAFRTITS